MSFFHWLATGSSNGILLEQEKEPALSKPFLPFYSAATLQSQSFDPGCSADGPIGKEDLCRVARLARIIDERDGNLLADKLEHCSAQKISVVCADAIDDEPYVSSQISPLLHCRSQVVEALTWIADALKADQRFIAVYKNMSSLNTKIPASIEGVPVRRMEGRYPMEIRAFRALGDDTLIIGSAALLHLYRAVTEGRVQTTSFVTVAGNCVTSPCNLEVTIGTPAAQILERCGLLREPTYLIEGSAMHGICVTDPENTAVRADTRSILAFHVDRQEQLYNCIGCGRCIEACPLGLNPHKLYQCVTTAHLNKATLLGIDRCIGCATCSYICPSRLDLAHTITEGKRRCASRKEPADR